MTLDTDSPSSLTALTELLAGFHLQNTLPWTSDQYLSHDAIQNAFTAFLEGLSRLPGVEKDLVGMVLAGIFTQFLNGICQPYTNAIGDLNNRISDLREAKDKLRDGCDKLRDEKDIIRTEKDKEIAHLREKTDMEITDLRDKTDMEITDLRDKTDKEITDLRDKTNKELTELRAKTEKEIADQREKTDKEIADQREKNDNQRDASDKLRDEKDKQITRLFHEKEDIIDQMQAMQMANVKRSAGTGTIAATVTVTELWNQVLNDENTESDEILPLIPINQQVTDAETATVVNGIYDDEYAMYPPMLSCLAAHLTSARTNTHPGSLVWDTHTKRNLEKRSPDLTITTQDVPDADSHSIIAVWEVKHGSLIKRDYGQLYGYLQLLGRIQPYRRNFVGVLSSLKKNVVIHYRSPLGIDPNACKVYQSVSTAYAISYLREFILRDQSYHPATPSFPMYLGTMYCRLGNPLLNVIAAFEAPKDLQDPVFRQGKWINPIVDATKYMVVKRTLPATFDRTERSVENEIEKLRYITSFNGHYHCLPKLVYHTNDYQEFGITPHGCPMRSGNTGINWPTALHDIISALQWLHDHGIIHRDVRLDNVIWDGRHAILIDLGESIFVTKDMDPVIYGGGYICCPPSLIGNFKQPYIPCPADDCLAFVQLISMLLWPAFWVGIKSKNVASAHAKEAQKLTRFWEGMAKSSYFSKYLDAAKVAEYDVLKGMVELCVYF